MVAHDWPGNVRELRNVVERAVVMNKKPEILPGDMPIYENKTDYTRLEVGLTLKEALDRFKAEFIIENLKHTSGNKSKAASIMGIQRTYLSKLISKYGLQN